ncbi:SDR family NAD(P)-dependent oxidoreductase [Clostridium sp. DMHC 10]|uniref:SDR family NAD(P)-dependent oxidoreductase n=1 Tax=Clostridium sp. DMHC 10 TaxID=747377 RepID=UPI000B254507
MNLNGKRIIITGASSGIGLELLKMLSKYDASIIAVGRNVENIPVINSKIIPYKCDVSKKENIDELFDFTLEKMKGIDIFVANAGFAYCEEINKADWNHAEKIFNTNVISPIYSFEKMKELNRGKRYTVAITCSAVSNVPLPAMPFTVQLKQL